MSARKAAPLLGGTLVKESALSARTLTCNLCNDFASDDRDAAFQHAIDEHAITLQDLRTSAMNPIFVDHSHSVQVGGRARQARREKRNKWVA